MFPAAYLFFQPVPVKIGFPDFFHAIGLKLPIPYELAAVIFGLGPDLARGIKILLDTVAHSAVVETFFRIFHFPGVDEDVGLNQLW